MRRKLRKLINKYPKRTLGVIAILVLIPSIFFITNPLKENYSNVSTNQTPETEDLQANTTESQEDLTYKTPWPPTELQKQCHKRLEADMNNPALAEQLGGVYCGGTGKYITSIGGSARIVYLDLDDQTVSGQPSNVSVSRFPTCSEAKTVVIVPHGTNYIDDPNMPLGQERVYSEGVDATTTECIDENGIFDSNLVMPVNEIVFVGSYVEEPISTGPTETSAPRYYYTRSEAQGICSPISQAGAGNSSAYEYCMRLYGY